MAKDFSYLFYPGDTLRQIQFFNLKQKGCYLDVLTCHIENIRFSYDFLMKITRELSDSERTEFLQIFEQDNEGYFVHWVVESIKKRAAYLLSRGSNKEGKTKEAKKKHKKITSKSYEFHMVNENEIENKNEKEKEKEKLKNEIIKNLSGNGRTPEEIETLATQTVEDDYAQFCRLTEWIEKHTPRVAQMKEPITLRQFVHMREEIKDKAKITELLKSMQNWQPLLKKNVSAYQTLLNWSKREN